MNATSCLLLSAVDLEEPCAGTPCPYWDEKCLLGGLKVEMSVNPPLVSFLLGLRDDLETPNSRPLLHYAPGFD